MDEQWRADLANTVDTIDKDAALLAGAVESGMTAEQIRDMIIRLQSQLRALKARIESGPDYGLRR